MIIFVSYKYIRNLIDPDLRLNRKEYAIRIVRLAGVTKFKKLKTCFRKISILRNTNG